MKYTKEVNKTCSSRPKAEFSSLRSEMGFHWKEKEIFLVFEELFVEGAGRLLKKGRLSEGNFKLHRRSLLEEKRLF